MDGRIAPLPQAQADVLAAEIGLPQATGRLKVFQTLANHPALARGVFTQHLAMRYGGKLPARLRELLIMRIAWRARSSYEWAQHWAVSGQEGIPRDDIAAVRDWHASGLFDAADRAVLAAVDDTFDQGMVTDATWAACAEHLREPAAMIELVLAIGHWSSLAQVFRSLEIPMEPGSSLWPPDGRTPT